MIDYNKKNDQIYIEITIVDSNLLLDFELDQNQGLNSDIRYDSTTTIRFVTPNRISLMW